MEDLSQKTVHKEKVRAAIVEAARQLLEKEGWESVSIRKIAERIGYSLPMVYTHFENKEAIQKEFVKQGFNLLTDCIVLQAATKTEPAQQLIALAVAYFDFSFSHACYYRLMFGLGIPGCQQVNEIAEIKRFTSVIFEVLGRLIPAASNERIFLKFHTLWSVLHGLASISMVNITGAADTLQKQVLLDAVKGFIKNIND
ncbi:TetR/AcrR family transcriptional regulator [Pedobacter sp.]|uniref:TetR/AcrR family transcriptional regulator n=1 Tax=Pedobacter sp. TaxID=1411316 RepID=UPI00396C4CE3